MVKTAKDSHTQRTMSINVRTVVVALVTPGLASPSPINLTLPLEWKGKCKEATLTILFILWHYHFYAEIPVTIL